MGKIGSWISKHRWLIIVLFTIVTVFMAYEASQVRIIDDITKYVPENDAVVSFFNKVANEFDMNDLILIGMDYKDLFSKSSLNNINVITNGIKEIRGVKSVISLTNAPWIEAKSGSVEISKIQNFVLNGGNTERLKKEIMNSPLFKGQFVSPNGKSTLIMVSLNASMSVQQSIKVTKNVENYVKTHSLAQKIYYSGIPPSNLTAQKLAKKNLETLIPLSLLAVALILFVLFRNTLGFLLPIISVIVSSTWSVGFIHLIGCTMTLANVAIPVIVIALGNAYGIYIVNKYLEEKDKDHTVRVFNTLRDIGIAVVLSASTAIASFLSLLTVNINPIRDFGIFTAVGIAFALLTNIFLTPALASFSEKHLSSKAEKSNRFGKNLGEIILKHKWAFISLTLISIGLFSVFILRIQSDMRLSVLLGKQNEVVKSMDYFNRRFNGSDFVIVNFNGNATDPYLLRSERLISIYALNHFKGVVGESYSLAKIIREMNKKFNGQNYIPSNRNKVQNLWFLMQGNNLSQLVNSQRSETVEQLRVNPSSLKEIEKLKKSLSKFTSKYVFKRYSYVNISKCTHKEKELAQESLTTYLTAYLQAKSLMASPTFIKSVVNEAINSTADEFLKRHAKDASNRIINYLKSFGMLEGISANTISNLKSGITESFENGYSQNSLKNALEKSVGLNTEEIFAPIIENQIPNVANGYKVNYIKNLLLHNIKGLTNEDANSLALVLSEKTVVIPQKNGKYSFKVGITGIPIVYNHVSNMLINAQYESMMISAIIVFILLMIQTSSVLMGFIGLIPVTLTVLFNFSIMGAFDIPLNAITITIASMTVGVGVDYVVQIFSRLRVEFKKSGDVHDAIVKSLATSGRGVLFNSIASSGGFAMLFSSNIHGLRQFGILAISTMIVALILAVLTLPGVLSLMPYSFYEKAFKLKKER